MKPVKIETFANGKLYNIGGVEVKPTKKGQDSDVEIRFKGLIVRSTDGQVTVERIPYGSSIPAV